MGDGEPAFGGLTEVGANLIERLTLGMAAGKCRNSRLVVRVIDVNMTVGRIRRRFGSRLPGAGGIRRHLLCTDIARDGMLAGFNLDLCRDIARDWPQLKLQASGGVRDASDVAAVRAAGASSAILGRALLEGRLDLSEALAC